MAIISGCKRKRNGFTLMTSSTLSGLTGRLSGTTTAVLGQGTGTCRLTDSFSSQIVGWETFLSKCCLLSLHCQTLVKAEPFAHGCPRAFHCHLPLCSLLSVTQSISWSHLHACVSFMAGKPLLLGPTNSSGEPASLRCIRGSGVGQPASYGAVVSAKHQPRLFVKVPGSPETTGPPADRGPEESRSWPSLL